MTGRVSGRAEAERGRRQGGRPWRRLPARSALAPALAACLLIACAGPAHVERTWTDGGRAASAEVHRIGEADALDSVERIRAEIERFMAVADADVPAAELGRVNREAATAPYRVQDPELYRCIVLALDYARATEGSVDPTVGPLTRLYRAGPAPSPAEIERAVERVGWHRVVLMQEARAVRFREPGVAFDLGRVAPGFALDLAQRVFSRPGTRAASIRLGDAYYAWGRPPGQAGWNVALEDPRSGSVLVEVQVQDRGLGVAAAETVRPGDPLLDPRTGRPPDTDVRVAVAIADSAADAALFSSALLVAGSRRSGALLSVVRRVESILFISSEKGAFVLASASLRDRLRFDGRAASPPGPVRYLLPPAAVE